MERTEEIKQYLKHKHQGGISNQKGGLYEDFYAVYQIVSSIAKYKSCFDDVEFQTQLEDTFVDDMLIANPKQHVYHQLKNTKSLSWGSADRQGDIAFDFANQIDDCKERDEDFALKLVYSLKDSKVGMQIPEEIKDYSSVEYFEFQDDLNRLVMLSTPLKEALAAIVPDGSSMDELVNVALVFLGAWKDCDSKNRISLREIIAKAERIKSVNLNIYPDAAMSIECKEVLDAIEDLKYHIKGRLFYWSIGWMDGSCPWPEKAESEILRIRPTDKWELIKLLSYNLLSYEKI
ncbi:MAG: hypothetical protein HUJ98_11085 [Bacteroidaceae bacterium]|nr:hypothetical protein [Bacteroidaceae bacterium]